MSPRMIDNSRWEWPSTPHPPSHILPNIIYTNTKLSQNNNTPFIMYAWVARLEHYGGF